MLPTSVILTSLDPSIIWDSENSKSILKSEEESVGVVFSFLRLSVYD